MTPEKQNLKKSLEDWAAVINKNAEVNFVEGLFRGALVSSAIIDKSSTWLLAGTGATVALMIANLDKLVPILGATTFRDSIYILVISAFLGFLAKYKSIHCQIILATEEEIKERVFPILETHSEQKDKVDKMAQEHEFDIATEIDIEEVIHEFNKAFPKIIRPFLLKEYIQSVQDHLSPSRKAANGLFWQGNYTILQFLTFLIFALLSISNINAT